MTKLDELLKKSKEIEASMTAEEREAMIKARRESYVRAEMSWPKPNFHWENGVKVYHSYEDYLND